MTERIDWNPSVVRITQWNDFFGPKVQFMTMSVPNLILMYLHIQSPRNGGIFSTSFGFYLHFVRCCFRCLTLLATVCFDCIFLTSLRNLPYRSTLPNIGCVNPCIFGGHLSELAQLSLRSWWLESIFFISIIVGESYCFRRHRSRWCKSAELDLASFKDRDTPDLFL